MEGEKHYSGRFSGFGERVAFPLTPSKETAGLIFDAQGVGRAAVSGNHVEVLLQPDLTACIRVGRLNEEPNVLRMVYPGSSPIKFYLPQAYGAEITAVRGGKLAVLSISSDIGQIVEPILF